MACGPRAILLGGLAQVVFACSSRPPSTPTRDGGPHPVPMPHDPNPADAGILPSADAGSFRAPGPQDATTGQSPSTGTIGQPPPASNPPPPPAIVHDAGVSPDGLRLGAGFGFCPGEPSQCKGVPSPCSENTDISSCVGGGCFWTGDVDKGSCSGAGASPANCTCIPDPLYCNSTRGCQWEVTDPVSDQYEIFVGLSNGSGFASSLWGRSDKLLWGAQVIDVDGDGKQDVVWVEPQSNAGAGRVRTNIKVAHSTGSSFQQTVWDRWDAPPGLLTLAGDFNGDHRGDFMKFDANEKYANGGLWVGLSTGSGFVTSEWAIWSTSSLMKVLAGDFNGDGKTDVMKFDVPTTGDAYGKASGLWVGLSTGASFSSSVWARWDTHPAMKVLAGDFNGDGKTDVMKFDVPTTGDAYGKDWGLWVGLSTGTSFSTSEWARWDTHPAMKVLAGDFNGDGKTDVMKFDVPTTGDHYGQDWGVWVGLSTGTSFSTSEWARWDTYRTMQVVSADVNGDGKTDIVKFDVAPGNGGYGKEGVWVGLSTGASFVTSKWDDWYTNPALLQVFSGDFNGDGKADVVKFGQ
jgi:hypothetical protein